MKDHKPNQSPHPVVSAHWLKQQLAAPTPERPLVVMDCSFDLNAPKAGELAYTNAHIPGALYADLDRHLSAHPTHKIAASGGRHPLPLREHFASTLGAWAIKPDTQVVVYDRNANMFGGRLWWMLKWCGHANVAVLDGGWQAWLDAGGASESGDARMLDASQNRATPYPLKAPLAQLRTVNQVYERLGSAETIVVDARATARFTGETEPLDPRAGHIPGALNRPFSANFDGNGLYKSPVVLQQEWGQLLDHRTDADLVMHCGSGVTAVPNIIAMVLAGYDIPALFAGSWSEWCSDPARPVATGA